MIKNLFPALALLVGSSIAVAQPTPYSTKLPDKVLLSNGWHLTPTGNSLPLGDLPLNLVVSPSKKYIAVTNNGQSVQSIQLIDARKEKVLHTEVIPKSWFGLKFSADEKYLYASGGNDNWILQYAITHNKLELKDSIKLGNRWPVKISPAGLEIDEQTAELRIPGDRVAAVRARRVGVRFDVRLDDGVPVLERREHGLVLVTARTHHVVVLRRRHVDLRLVAVVDHAEAGEKRHDVSRGDDGALRVTADAASRLAWQRVDGAAAVAVVIRQHHLVIEVGRRQPEVVGIWMRAEVGGRDDRGRHHSLRIVGHRRAILGCEEAGLLVDAVVDQHLHADELGVGEGCSQVVAPSARHQCVDLVVDAAMHDEIVDRRLAAEGELRPVVAVHVRDVAGVED